MIIKSTKILILLVGIVCIFILVVTRMERMPDLISDKKLIDEEDKGVYGDLYFLCMLDYFKVNLPEYYPTFVKSGKLKDINNADILVLGDSFVRMSRVEKNFLQFLNDSLNKNVYFKQEFGVLNLLNEEGYKKANSKVILLEIIERHICDNFKNRQTRSSSTKKEFSDLLKFIVPYDREIYFQYVLQKSILTSKIYNIVVNLRFNMFKEISETVPVYSIMPPWLFLYKDVDKKFTSFYNKYSNEDIEKIADNILYLSEDLKTNYNLDFVFFPVPNKFSLYSGVVNNDTYNMFLPRLYSALDKRGVKTIKIFDEFKKSAIELYYPTDTHWNPDGNRLVRKLFLEQMNNFYPTH